MTYDLVIKGGTVVDPSQGLHETRDVGLSAGKVAAIEASIPRREAREVLDAEGLIVTPGLIDLHVHAYWGVCAYGVEPDLSNIARGVTTAMDCGSAGARTFPAFRRYIMERSDTRLFALLNISAMGIISHEIGELPDQRWADVDEAIEVGRLNRDLVKGIKVRLSKGIVDNDSKVDMLKRAIEAAEALDALVMVHVGDRETPLDTLTPMLRPGDVVTHAFRYEGGVVGEDRHVLEGLWEDKQRGIIFDVGHGAGSFSFDTADHAMSQGFFPDNISSDVSTISIEGPVFDLVTTISKFLHIGLSLNDVIRLCTASAASAMAVDDELGTLKVGAEGDVTVLSLDEGEYTFTDAQGVSVTAGQRLNHVATVKGGQVYRPWLR